MEKTEAEIMPPTSPLTAKINMAVLDWYFKQFAERWLPAFDTVITSGYRDPAHNSKVGGVGNSAHLHGLAYDFILKFKDSGKVVPTSQFKKVFDDYIAPNWPGFALWEEDHVHVNLSRQITQWAAIAGTAFVGVIGFKLISSMGLLKNGK